MKWNGCARAIKCWYLVIGQTTKIAWHPSHQHQTWVWSWSWSTIITRDWIGLVMACSKPSFLPYFSYKHHTANQLKCCFVPYRIPSLFSVMQCNSCSDLLPNIISPSQHKSSFSITEFLSYIIRFFPSPNIQKPILEPAHLHQLFRFITI